MGTFPGRFAAIDMGTNSFHLIIAEVKNDGRLKILDREREFIRLGSEHENDLSIISEKETEAAITVLNTFLSIAKYHNAKIRAVSTSAVREAKNKTDFVENVFKQTGIKVEVIEGTEEAKLIFLGMRNALPIDNNLVFGIDIGGGSAEFIYGVNGKPVFAESIKIGAVRLSKKFFPDFIISDSSVIECTKYVEEQIKMNQNINNHIKFDFAVGSSGTIDTICMLRANQIAGQKKKKMNGYSFNDSEFYEIYESIMKLKTSAERISIPGIEAKRADIFPSGLIVLKKAFEIFHIKKMTLSDYALREGIVYDCINKNLKAL